MIFIIGRNPNSQYQIPDTSVSRIHASLEERENGEYLLKNLNEENYSQVNGVTYSEKLISVSDEVILGKFKLNLKSVLEKYQEIKNENKTDFTHEINALKANYDEYTRKRNSVEIINALAYRILPVVLVFIVGYLLQNKIVQGLSLIVGIIINTNPYANNKKKEKLEVLENSLDDFWFCPNNKCKLSFRGRTWVGVKDKGRCYNPTCKATW